MTAVRQPRSVPAATALCERFAELEGQLAAIEEGRQDAIAAVNARADTAQTDLIAERDAIAAKLAPWWRDAAAELTKNKRKSIELGGCIVGSRTQSAALVVDGDAKQVANELAGLRWGRALVKTSYSLDRGAIARALGGKRAGELEALGCSMGGGGEAFFVKRAEQGGTRSGAGR